MPTESLSLQAGLFRHRIQVQAPSTSQDSIGGLLTTWTPVLTTKAMIANQQTATYKAATSDDTVTSQNSYIFTIRFPNSVQITTAMRILFRGQVFTVNSCNDRQQRRLYLDLFAMSIDGSA